MSLYQADLDFILTLLLTFLKCGTQSLCGSTWRAVELQTVMSVCMWTQILAVGFALLWPSVISEWALFNSGRGKRDTLCYSGLPDRTTNLPERERESVCVQASKWDGEVISPCMLSVLKHINPRTATANKDFPQVLRDLYRRERRLEFYPRCSLRAV